MTFAAGVLLGLSMVASAPGADVRARAAPAAREPLLVVVERSHGATASPEQVRRAIAEELGRPVVGPADDAARTASQMLVVTLSADSVSMQLRAAGDAAPRRRIEPLVSGDSHLRVVGWLAGNLARDQAGELREARAAAPTFHAPPLPPMPVIPAAPPPSSVRPAPPPPSVAAADAPIVPTQPPAFSPVAPAAVATAPATPPARAPGEAPWRLELAFGRAVGTSTYHWYANLPTDSFERIEVLAPVRSGHWSWAAGFDIVNSAPGDHLYTVSGAFVRRFDLVTGWLTADASLGGGMLFARDDGIYPAIDGAVYTNSGTAGPYLVGHAAGSLAIVHLRVLEIAMTARVSDVPAASLDSWKEPFFTFCLGARVALQ